jgi:hypothetical protein
VPVLVSPRREAQSWPEFSLRFLPFNLGSSPYHTSAPHWELQLGTLPKPDQNVF